MNKPTFEDLTPTMCREPQLRKHWPEYCAFLDGDGRDLPMKEKMYLDLKGLEEPLKCPICGNRLKFVSLRYGYQQYCSSKCSNSAPEKIQLTKEVNLEKFGVEVPAQSKEVQDKMKKTCLEKYGTENAMSNKDISKKAHDTYIERHGGIGNGSEEVREKMKQTMLERYGVDNAVHSKELKAKMIQTTLEKYGAETPFGNKDIQEKAAKTRIERYGTNIPLQNEEIKRRLIESNMEKYGVPWYCLSKEFCSSFKNDSKPNKEFAKMLDEANILYEKEFVIENKRYDFKVNNYLIEINPFSTHNSTWGIIGKDPMSKDYHLKKSKLAKDNGFQCIHVWDWDDKDKVIRFLSNKSKIYGRECDIKEIDNKEAIKFLEKYHFQNSCKGINTAIALIYNDEIVGLMCFGKPRYNKKYDVELLRLCYKDDITIIGGTKKMLNHYIKNYSPKSIISYCDKSKFSGKVYEELGFKLLRSSSPSLHWYNGKKHYTDFTVRKYGADKLLGTNYGKGTNNSTIFKLNNYVEIYDSGQDTYILEL